MPTNLPPPRQRPGPIPDAQAFGALVVWGAIIASLVIGKVGPLVSPRHSAAWWDACAAAGLLQPG